MIASCQTIVECASGGGGPKCIPAHVCGVSGCTLVIFGHAPHMKRMRSNCSSPPQHVFRVPTTFPSFGMHNDWPRPAAGCLSKTTSSIADNDIVVCSLACSPTSLSMASCASLCRCATLAGRPPHHCGCHAFPLHFHCLHLLKPCHKISLGLRLHRSCIDALLSSEALYFKKHFVLLHACCMLYCCMLH